VKETGCRLFMVQPPRLSEGSEETETFNGLVAPTHIQWTPVSLVCLFVCEFRDASASDAVCACLFLSEK
jgi:hypothetical protein